MAKYIQYYCNREVEQCIKRLWLLVTVILLKTGISELERAN